MGSLLFLLVLFGVAFFEAFDDLFGNLSGGLEDLDQAILQQILRLFKTSLFFHFIFHGTPDPA